MILKKTVDIQANGEIYIFGPPQKGTFMNIELTVGDILAAIRQGAYVYETDRQGQRIRLNADNYDKDINVKEEVKEETANVELKPVEAPIVDEVAAEIPVVEAAPTPVVEEQPAVVEEVVEEKKDSIEEEVTAPQTEEEAVEVKEETPVEESNQNKKYRSEKRR